MRAAGVVPAVLAAGLVGAAAPAIPPFAEQAPPAVPDYAAPANWAARPGAPGTAAAVPPGAVPAARHPQADVFFIHPTTFRGHDRWNADVSDQATNRWTDASAMARQASIFNACCRVIAPRYRQASLAAFAAPDGDGDRAYDLAYRDVLRAFNRYVARDNGGRPFILAGHSQGALLAKRLLAERIAGSPLAGRLVAAYLVGVGVSQGEFGRALRATPPCVAPQQTGCVLSWNSFLANGDTAAYRLRATAPYRARFGDAGAELLCTNPLALGGGAAAAARGALPGAPDDGPLRPLVPGAVAARCADGVLMVTPDPALALALAPLPGGSLHYHDMALFYADVRADAVRRVDAFGARGRGR